MPSAADNAPAIVGHYVIERALARGSMGSVYVAHHELTHARVALKVLRAEVAGDEQAEERFLREVRAAAHIGHEGIVRVHDAGRSADGRLFLAMELLEGETLEQRLARTPGERLQAMHWLLQVLEPLSAAHAQGIIHRDLKPANVFIARTAAGDEHIKLLDFGLARDTREKSVTATGIALGTPYYMSPEQATQPRDVGPASDVWSMGVMMYEVLCGAMPFDGETLHAVVIRSSVVPHVATAERAAGIDPELAALVDACLDKDPSKRPPNAHALRERVRALVERPEVQGELAQSIAVTARQHRSQTQSHAPAMPFAETAISLLPREPARPASSGRAGSIALWIVMLSVLSAAVAGFVWVIRERSHAQPDALSPPSAAAAATASERAAGTEHRARTPHRSESLPDKRDTLPDKGSSSVPGLAALRSRSLHDAAVADSLPVPPTIPSLGEPPEPVHDAGSQHPVLTP
jgi:serine/threonine-protein kinase